MIRYMLLSLALIAQGCAVYPVYPSPNPVTYMLSMPDFNYRMRLTNRPFCCYDYRHEQIGLHYHPTYRRGYDPMPHEFDKSNPKCVRGF